MVFFQELGAYPGRHEKKGLSRETSIVTIVLTDDPKKEKRSRNLYSDAASNKTGMRNTFFSHDFRTMHARILRLRGPGRGWHGSLVHRKCCFFDLFAKSRAKCPCFTLALKDDLRECICAKAYHMVKESRMKCKEPQKHREGKISPL